MRPFTYTALPSRVVFGSGVIATAAEELDALGCKRVLLLSSARGADRTQALARALGPRLAGAFNGAVMHTPVEVTETAFALVRALEIDGLIALGGGSVIGLSKALALRSDLPQVVVPTTYAGSEATPILGETRDGLKTTQRSLKVLPETILYDVDLTLGLPSKLSATSGLNALAHAAEGLYARDANPIITLIAEDGVRALASALPAIMDNPLDFGARSRALYGAWACGVTLGAVGMSLHHKLCHVLGGALGLPHAETHSVILPHAMAYNVAAAPEAMARLAAALGVDDAPRGLHALAARLGAPTSLAALGMPENEIGRMADLAMSQPYWNPRPLEREAIQGLLTRAWRGERPDA